MWNYHRACQEKVKRNKSRKPTVPLCFPLTLNHSGAQIIHMYRTPYSPTHAAGPLLQMNAPLEIILIKVQSLFSSFACSGVSKEFFISLFPSILLCTLPLFLLFRLRQRPSGAEGGVCVEVVGGCTSRLKAEKSFAQHSKRGSRTVVWDRIADSVVWEVIDCNISTLCVYHHAKRRGSGSLSPWRSLCLAYRSTGHWRGHLTGEMDRRSPLPGL